MTTRFLPLAQHTMTGVVLSDTTLRLVTLKQHKESVIPERYAELLLPDGWVTNGKITNKGAFVAFLKKTRKTYNIETVAIALALSPVQTFNVSAKAAGALYIKEAIEKVFGLPAKDIAYDYNSIAADEQTTVFHVTAVPKNISQDITTAFHSAGITVLTIESVAHALTRDSMPSHSHHTAMIVDIDAAITSLTFVVRGKVAHSVLLEAGDSMFIDAIMKTLEVDEAEADRLKQQDGLITRQAPSVFDAVHDDCTALVHQINETYIQWQTEHPVLPPIETIYLTGAGSTMRGLDEYLSAGLRIPVQNVNVWTNCLSFDDHIPSIPQSLSVRYGAAIGAALVGGDSVNLLPHKHKQALRRKHIARLSGTIFLSFVFGVAVGFAVAKIIAIPSIHTALLAGLHKIHAQW